MMLYMSATHVNLEMKNPRVYVSWSEEYGQLMVMLTPLTRDT